MLEHKEATQPRSIIYRNNVHQQTCVMPLGALYIGTKHAIHLKIRAGIISYSYPFQLLILTSLSSLFVTFFFSAFHVYDACF